MEAMESLNVVKAAVAEIQARYNQQDAKIKRKQEQLAKVNKMIEGL